MAVIDIPLTRGFVAQIDDIDADRVLAKRWHVNCQRGGRLKYAVSSRMEAGRQVTVYLHRFILEAPADVLVDHADRDGLNDIRSNLRLCTLSQNLANTRTLRGAIPFKGVHFSQREQRFRAKIRFDNRHIGLGYFTDPVEAARAYDDMAVKLFGEFAQVNFPQSLPAGARL